MDFKSQICTSREQSERLLKLGLKRATADMVHQPIGATPFNVWYKEEIEDDFYPAWSLHRLIELVDGNISIDDFAIEWAYDTVIDHIAFDIKYDEFNHEYLEEKK